MQTWCPTIPTYPNLLGQNQDYIDYMGPMGISDIKLLVLTTMNLDAAQRDPGWAALPWPRFGTRIWPMQRKSGSLGTKKRVKGGRETAEILVESWGYHGDFWSFWWGTYWGYNRFLLGPMKGGISAIHDRHLQSWVPSENGQPPYVYVYIYIHILTSKNYLQARVTYPF